ncbi:unnamed protein product [Bemisia tabaci]|uniref:Uncharacterized protein n=1 Tax=Bemisia tabaci TaxID=7038 RepID=A0A9P0EZM0_BEMTA|nr:unnamed protein product [Bemisia tabaci]
MNLTQKEYHRWFQEAEMTKQKIRIYKPPPKFDPLGHLPWYSRFYHRNSSSILILTSLACTLYVFEKFIIDLRNAPNAPTDLWKISNDEVSIARRRLQAQRVRQLELLQADVNMQAFRTI